MKDAYLAHFFRYLWDEKNLLVIRGDGSLLMDGRAAYNLRYGIAPDKPEQERELGRLMTACGLAAVSLSERESWGWSVTHRQITSGYFCGVEPEGMVCGSLRESAASAQGVVVQRQKPEEELTQSHFIPEHEDVIESVTQYFAVSEQVASRLVIVEQGESILLRALPGGQLEEFAALSDEQISELVKQQILQEQLKQLDEVLLFYACRCDEDMILNMILNLPQAQREELWGDETSLHVDCPRCGRGYTLNRQG